MAYTETCRPRGRERGEKRAHPGRQCYSTGILTTPLSRLQCARKRTTKCTKQNTSDNNNNNERVVAVSHPFVFFSHLHRHHFLTESTTPVCGVSESSAHSLCGRAQRPLSPFQCGTTAGRDRVEHLRRGEVRAMHRYGCWPSPPRWRCVGATRRHRTHLSHR